MNSLRNFFTAPLLAAGLLLGAGGARAAVTWSGVVDIGIPTSFNGVYLDLAATSPAGNPTEPSNDDPAEVNFDSYAIGYDQPTDWDINFFFGGIGIAYSPTFNPFVESPGVGGSQILNVEEGTNIASNVSQALGLNSYGGSGTPSNSDPDSLFSSVDGSLPSQYSSFATDGTPGYIAFTLETASGTQYGWMQVTLDPNGPDIDGAVGKVHQWAYSDDINFTVGQIPEPSSLVLLLLGSAGLLRRRR
ncbi:PEP-CTERM sorting domain-containing protein [Haloferula sp. A504]|uniref:PEP-CTERM sorting domain-containing protein n=1 Tax=Haloferula sp. A504 TaxID=3373601 RepID=UPI0031C3FD17|nr:PEP-CTERM sorting domain-containing protein [Verrucomicrobiaceae bacterium E54]